MPLIPGFGPRRKARARPPAPARGRRLGRRSHRGMSLIEVAVAVAVLSLGTLAVLRAIDQSGRTIGTQAARVIAHEVALNRAAELRLVGLDAGRALPAEVEMGTHRWRIALAETETAGGLVAVTVTVRAPGQPGAQLTVHAGPAATGAGGSNGGSNGGGTAP